MSLTSVQKRLMRQLEEEDRKNRKQEQPSRSAVPENMSHVSKDDVMRVYLESLSAAAGKACSC